MPVDAALLAPSLVGIVVLALAIAPELAEGRRPDAWRVVQWLLVLGALFATTATLAFAAIGTSSLMLGVQAWRTNRVGAGMLLLASLATVLVAGAVAWRGVDVVALGLSLFAISLRSGVAGLHAGVASLLRHSAPLQAAQFATLPVLVFVHLRFLDHIDAAHAVAPAMVLVGAISALIFALITLVPRSLDDLLQGSTLMHGGFLFAAVGAAGRGHHAAALFVCLTMALALCGLFMMVTSLEDRVGPVNLMAPGGRARALPRLAAAFAFFGAAGVGMPGTAGFIADDLLLHALWEESVGATVVVILGSAILAVATLMAYSKVFLGRAVPSLAPDLGARERWVAVLLVFALVWLGIVPATLLEPADPFLRAVGDPAAH